MPILIKDVTIFSIEDGESKNGYFANIIFLNMNTKSKLEYFTKDKILVNKLREFEQNGNLVQIECTLKQSKFGLMLGDILAINE